MSTMILSPFLRRAFLLDAAFSGVAGLLLALAAGWLADPLGLPVPLLRYVGLALLPYAALLAFLATREALPRFDVWVIVAGNAVWTTASILLLVSGWIEPTTLGIAFVVAQAAAVAVFAELQWFGLKRSAPAVA
jgi:hypothetical protein